MNREDILNMEVGKELDVLIATKVFGLPEPYQSPFNGKWCIKLRSKVIAVEDYSSDISAAWEVEARLRELDLWIHIQVTGNLWYGVQFWNPKTGQHSEVVHFNTAPEAICKAALLAVMEDSHETG